MSWRDDKPTQAQLTAIKNILHGFNLSRKGKIKTKGQAHDEIQRLIKAAEDKKKASSYNYSIGCGMSARDEWAYEMGFEASH